MPEKNFEYVISVIMPIYNVQKYLQESIESVVNQTLGFENNIQLILVNDGSTDDSEEICLEYQKKYPDNIQYVYQNNAGVSAARNYGLELARGRYINFLDADDKWTWDVFESAIDFLKHHNGIPFVACKMHFFEGNDGYHYLSRGDKFKESREIDIEEEYKFLQLHAASAVFCREAIGDIRFDTELRYGEDALFLNTILLQHGKYGVLADPEYFYRKRSGENSVIQGATTNKEYYLSTVERFICAIANKKVSNGRLESKYVQNLICYEIRSYAKLKATEYLDKQEYKVFMNHIMQLTQLVDDELLFRTKDLSLHKKIALAEMKHKCDIKDKLQMYNGNLIWNNQAIFSLDSKPYMKLVKMHFSERKMIMELEIPGIFTDLMDIRIVEKDAAKHLVCWEDIQGTGVFFFEKLISTTKKAIVELDVEQATFFFFSARMQDGSICIIEPDISDGICIEKKGFGLKLEEIVD